MNCLFCKNNSARSHLFTREELCNMSDNPGGTPVWIVSKEDIPRWQICYGLSKVAENPAITFGAYSYQLLEEYEITWWAYNLPTGTA